MAEMASDLLVIMIKAKSKKTPSWPQRISRLDKSNTNGFAFCTNQRLTELSAEFSKPPLTLSEARLVERTLTGATVSDVSPKNSLHFMVVMHEVCSWVMVFNQSLKSLRVVTSARFYPPTSLPLLQTPSYTSNCTKWCPQIAKLTYYISVN
jgi:hypothetical protein